MFRITTDWISYLMLSIAVSTSTLFGGCDSFVEDVEDPIEVILDDKLNDESQIDLIINGLKDEFSYVYGNLATRGGLLSDELIIDSRNPSSGDAHFEQVDRGEIPFDNVPTTKVHRIMGEFRARADDFISRVGEIEFVDSDNKRKALFAGHFYAGIARYFMAAFGGLRPREGGGVITLDADRPGEFIGSTELYELALEHLEVARTYAPPRELRIINTIAARIHLIKGDLEQARAAAQAGLAVPEDPFEALYDAFSPNLWYGSSGPGGQPFVFDFVFKDFHDSDPAESNRIPLATKLGRDSSTFYFQNRYDRLDSPLPFATWQENELILAEVEFRSGDVGSAQSRVNTVRAHYGIAPLDTIDSAVIEEERRKELWGTGLRLIDQRRFESWHLGPDTWQYFPIPQAERDINPNL